MKIRAPKTSATKSGFLFTALALVLLTFMLASLSASAAASAAAEKTYAYRFKVESLNSLLESTSDEQLSNFAQMSLQHSLSQLAAYTATTQPLSLEPTTHADNSWTANVNTSLYELMLNGTTRGGTSGFLTPLSLPRQEYSLSSWKKTLNASASAAGFSLIFGEISSFDAFQSDQWTVTASFSIPISIQDAEGTFLVQKTLHANAAVPIDGIYDPFVAREDARRRLNAFPAAGSMFAQKQIFHSSTYAVPSDVAPRIIDDEEGNIAGGLGWFYGSALELSQDDIPMVNASDARQSILVSDYYSGIEAHGHVFGAVAITSLPTEDIITEENGGCTTTITQEEECVNCRRREVEVCNGNTVRDDLEITNHVNFSYIVTDGRGWLVGATAVPTDSLPHVLFDNEHGTNSFAQAYDGYHRVFDIEKLRDMAICGLYVQNPQSLSFFQRMLDFPTHSLPSSPLGIESFVVGRWAGGADDTLHDEYSRLDRQFYAGEQGTRIKGMSGCKSREMCSSEDAITYGVGHFRLDAESMDDYMAGPISCNGTSGGGCG